jgi:hypothetical protein
MWCCPSAAIILTIKLENMWLFNHPVTVWPMQTKNMILMVGKYTIILVFFSRLTIIYLGILHMNSNYSSESYVNKASLNTIIEHLQSTYCGRIAYEFIYMPVIRT